MEESDKEMSQGQNVADKNKPDGGEKSKYDGNEESGEISKGEDAEESVRKDETAVTMLDVLKDEEELEEDANAVLGAADDQNCTYDQGYQARQALYACTSCSQPDNPDFVAAGICLACSYHCHEGHDLVELYTKRQFRCDCPTEKFSSDHKCRLRPGRMKQNDKNSYNQNFSGLYCECSRPYPDPEDSIEDEMIQCAVCEDWFHGRHLGLSYGPPNDSEYGEMICRACVNKFSILINYKNCQIPEGNQSDVKPTEGGSKSEVKCKLKVKPSDLKNEASKAKDENATQNSCDKEDSIPGESETCESAKEEATPDEKSDKNNDGKSQYETLFVPEGWRDLQCRCSDCRNYYKDQKIEFLLDQADTVHHYESQGKKRASQFDQGMEELSRMDRVQQVEAISMYNNMKTDLMDYLAQFARQGKVVKEEDIRKFFSEMKSAKRPRLDLPPPDTCK